jgi:hypothetical protein
MLISFRLAAECRTSVRTGEVGYIAFSRGIPSFMLARRTAVRERKPKLAKRKSRRVRCDRTIVQSWTIVAIYQNRYRYRYRYR